jgi:hypothetical protein
VNGPYVLPEDGIVDLVAVEIAAAGTRRVWLTLRERRLAAALIMARGGTANDISARLHVNGSVARALAAGVLAAATTDTTEEVA